MTYSFHKSFAWAFLVSAAIYTLIVSFIDYPVTTFLKPIPMIFLIFGVFKTPLIPWAKALLLFALGFSLIGDIVLTLPIKFSLELGIGYFLLAHCFYIALFLKSFEFNKTHLFYYVIILILIGLVLYTVLPYLGGLLIPVMIYVCVLLSMVFCAFQVKRESFIISSGALFFLMSDLTISLNMFVYPELNVQAITLFTYYAAQFLLTFGIARLYQVELNQSGQIDF